MSLLHHAADFYAVGQSHAEGVETGGETTEVDDSLFLEGNHAAAGVVENIHALHLLVSLDGQFAHGGVGVECDVAGLRFQAVASVVQVSLGSHAERDVTLSVMSSM